MQSFAYFKIEFMIMVDKICFQRLQMRRYSLSVNHIYKNYNITLQNDNQPIKGQKCNLFQNFGYKTDHLFLARFLIKPSTHTPTYSFPHPSTSPTSPPVPSPLPDTSLPHYAAPADLYAGHTTAVQDHFLIQYRWWRRNAHLYRV